MKTVWKSLRKLKKLGVVGVKIDFFESEKQDMIRYYLDILDDAAKFEMMVYFHGCLVPRWLARTYPNLMTYEVCSGSGVVQQRTGIYLHRYGT